MILALNLRVSPPGAPPSPRARSEAWIMPSKKKNDRSVDVIARVLKEQFLNLCPKASRTSRSFLFKQCQDPPVDTVKSMCVQMRTFAKDKRIVLHYNGHGVPKPSSNGEIWVFNRELTQYIPLSLYDLQTWVGGPCVYIFDCDKAGLIIDWLAKFTEQRKDEQNRNYLARGNTSSSNKNTSSQSEEIQYGDYCAIAACSSNESLPSNKENPADILTCCLTTPIKMSLRWASSRTILQYRFLDDDNGKIDYLSLIDKLPGNLDDRQTPLGELNWIFTAITETIAWEVVSPELFQKLFREDPIVASLFRNYLLADRILRDAQCTPVSYPKLPASHYHPMWKTWDQVLDFFLEQLPRIVRQPKSFQSSSFFQDHLTSFEVWLSFAQSANNFCNINSTTSSTVNNNTSSSINNNNSTLSIHSNTSQNTNNNNSNLNNNNNNNLSSNQNKQQQQQQQQKQINQKNRHPRELPIVLQALLSPIHRLRALEVFKQFLDLGVWAVNLSLAVGVFHYVLRLLQRASGPSASILIFIWTKIIAADHSLQEDLLKVDAHLFFIKVLKSSEYDINDRIRAAFVLSIIMDEYPPGQAALLKADLISICSSILTHSNDKLRKWAVICIGKVCENNVTIKQNLVKSYKIQDLFLQKIHDQFPDNRAAVIYAIGNFIATGVPIDDCELDLAISLKTTVADINPVVRRELVTTFSHLTFTYEEEFKKVALANAKQEVSNLNEQERLNIREIVSSDFGRVWRMLYAFQFDPIPSLSSAANQVVIRIHSLAANDLFKDPESMNNSDSTESIYSFLTNVANLQIPGSNGSNFPINGETTTLFNELQLKTAANTIRKQFSEWRRSAAITKPSLSSSSSNHDNSSHQVSSGGGGGGSGFTHVQIRSLRRSNMNAVSGFNSDQQPRTADHRASICINKRGHPVGSKLYQWACEEFNFPSLHPIDEEQSPMKVWKTIKQEKMIETMDNMKNEVATQKLETQCVAMVNEPYLVLGLKVHPFYNVIVSTSNDDVIRVYDWKQKALINKFSNTNPSGTFVSSLSFINELEDADLLMTGATDGVIRVWRTYYNNNAEELCTAWRAHKQSDNSTPLCHLWNQTDGTVVCIFFFFCFFSFFFC